MGQYTNKDVEKKVFENWEQFKHNQAEREKADSMVPVPYIGYKMIRVVVRGANNNIVAIRLLSSENLAEYREGVRILSDKFTNCTICHE